MSLLNEPLMFTEAVRAARVTLVGAGPGDPELLTLKAAKALRAARLVLYDHLVGKEVLDLVPRAPTVSTSARSRATTPSRRRASSS